MLNLKNTENIKEFNIRSDWLQERKNGISAFVRVHNEEDFLEPCLKSILPIFDEVVILINNCTDRSEDIVQGIDNNKIRVYYYPYEIWPTDSYKNRYNLKDPYSVHSRTYFTNWAMTKTSRRIICRWDADMVAMNGVDFSNLKENTIYNFGGINIGQMRDGNLFVSNLGVGSENRIHTADPNINFRSGRQCNDLVFPFQYCRVNLGSNIFLHFKWCKKSFDMGWVKNWKEINHYKNLAKNGRTSKCRYTGEIPTSIKEILDG